MNTGHIYPSGDVDLIPDAMKSLDLSLEKNENDTIGVIDDPASSFLQNMQEAIDKRRGEEQDEFWPWLEEGVPVTKEDVQDYVTYFGTNSETAYERIKKYAIREVGQIESESAAKDLTEKRAPLTPEQIAKLWTNPERK